MKFVIDRKYFSEDRFEMYVVGRFDNTNIIRAEIGFGLPKNFKIRKDHTDCEYILANGRVYRAFP